jgi:hypothetical protein
MVFIRTPHYRMHLATLLLFFNKGNAETLID